MAHDSGTTRRQSGSRFGAQEAGASARDAGRWEGADESGEIQLFESSAVGVDGLG